MTATSFFKKVGRGLQRGVGDFTRSAGKVAGGVLGKQLMTSALEAAPMLLKTGGAVKGGRNKKVPAILHGGEYVLPHGIKPTKAQKAAVAKNKREQKLGKFY
jgi:hypothetical protein